jgi:hypothetical protein
VVVHYLWSKVGLKPIKSHENFFIPIRKEKNDRGLGDQSRKGRMKEEKMAVGKGSEKER